MRNALAAGVIVLSCLVWGAPGTTAAATEPEPTATATSEWAPTPEAGPGTPRAARGTISRSALRRELARQMRRAGGRGGAWVGTLKGDGVASVFADSASASRLLASNSKLFTTAAYLGRFGAEGRLTTRLHAQGARSGPGNRVLEGALFLVGDGDPALSGSGLTRLATATHAAGIRKIEGGIRADDAIFDRRRSVPQPGITGGPFLGPLSGLAFAEGRVSGDPARVAVAVLRRKLRRRGVRVRGGTGVARTPKRVLGKPPIGVVESPTALGLIAQTNTPSDNFYAETLLKRLSAGNRRQGTTKRGARRAERFAAGLGSQVSLDNGSGLSRRNVAKPKHVARLLSGLAADRALAEPFRASLPIAGRTGTLAGRMRGTAAEGRCQAKTGSLDGVSALSGYCTAGGREHVFSILMGAVNLDSARRAQDAMVAAIARFR